MVKKKIGRPKKDGCYVNCRIRRDLYDRLSHDAVSHARTKTSALEHMLMMYFDSDTERIDEEDRRRQIRAQAAALKMLS